MAFAYRPKALDRLKSRDLVAEAHQLLRQRLPRHHVSCSVRARALAHLPTVAPDHLAAEANPSNQLLHSRLLRSHPGHSISTTRGSGRRGKFTRSTLSPVTSATLLSGWRLSPLNRRPSFFNSPENSFWRGMSTVVCKETRVVAGESRRASDVRY